MRIYGLVVLVIMSIAARVDAGYRVEEFVKCKQPVIIDGNWLNPENGGYLLVMTDDYLTVNGYEFVHSEDKSINKYAPPDKEKNFLDWICRTTVAGAQNILNNGGSSEEAREYMEQRFADHVEDGVFWYEYDKDRGFALHYKGRDPRVPLWVHVPSRPETDKIVRSYRELVIEPLFTELLYYLENGFVVMRGTRDASMRSFRPEEAAAIKKELKDAPTRAVRFTDTLGHTRYQPLIVGGKYKLGSSEIDLLVHPRPLIRRQ